MAISGLYREVVCLFIGCIGFTVASGNIVLFLFLASVRDLEVMQLVVMQLVVILCFVLGTMLLLLSLTLWITVGFQVGLQDSM